MGPQSNPRRTTMINTTAVTADQFKLAQEIIKLNKGPIISRGNLAAAHLKLRKKSASPYWVAKNKACKTKTVGQYDLSVLKVAADAAKPAKVAKAKTSSAPKKVAKAVAKK
jgi:ABC-type uncharacterized transport system ATPase subunit